MSFYFCNNFIISFNI